MNYRVYSDRADNLTNRDYPVEMSQDPDYELVEAFVEEDYDLIGPQDMMPMYEAFPEEDMFRDDDMDMENDMMNPQITNMHHIHPTNQIMPCCMLQDMGTLPYMFELEDDDDDDDNCDEIKDIMKKIEKHHPEILTILSSYGIPYMISSKILKRIIHLTLKYK
jgi:hypothetical protein